ncbi:MAG: hypothetical protein IK131_12810 [Paludibacteraceae bacterium]|nr:hypothetical protein [Paludibacteraceae bacterium]
MTQLYWQVYLNLERDFLSIADTIHINDKQQEVYSMKIADLLIRTVIEIEALSKDLYLSNGGKMMDDADMYFDTVCMEHLNNLWKLDQKIVSVVSPAIYLEKEENIILRPLFKANKRGTSSADWNKAYQAVKHNRVKELSKGSIKHLLHGLAALYVLNLYYRNESIKDISSDDRTSVNPSFGSSLFAVRIHELIGLKVDGTYHKRGNYDECIYLEDHEQNSKRIAMEAVNALNDLHNNAAKKLLHMAQEKKEKGEEVTMEWIQQESDNIYNDLISITYNKLEKRIYDSFSNIRYDIVLNKQQY